MKTSKCEEKGFIVEVAGVGNPDVPPLILSTAPNAPGKEWCPAMPKEPDKSPRTIYAADFTEKDAKEQDYKLYLSAPGLNTPLLVYPYNPKAPDEPNGVMPTGYKNKPDAFQDYIFIPFRPVTAILNPNDESNSGSLSYLMGYGEYGGQEKKDDDRPEDIKGHLRILRKGYLYIFRDTKLWRELIVFADGSFTDIDLAEERPKKADQRGPQDHEGSGLAQEIWLPFSAGKTKNSTRASRAEKPFDFRIAFSEKQWSWAYIEWLEGGNYAEKRLDPLEPLYKLYKEHVPSIYADGSLSVPPRFSGLMQELQKDHEECKFYPVEFERGNLLTESVGFTSRLVESAAWQNAPADAGLSSKKNDWELFRALYQPDVPPNYNLAHSLGGLPSGTVFGPGAKQGRGLFLVNDYLYSPLFHAVRVSFYADMLIGFDNLLQRRPYAATLWQILDSLRYNETERAKLVSCLNMPKLEGAILPAQRQAARLALEQSLRDLHDSLITNVHNGSKLPGSYLGDLGNPSRTRAALHDLFALEGEDYVSGWAWLKTVAQALMINPDTADSCHLPPETRYGHKGFLQGLADGLLSQMESWDCNGATLGEMLYPPLNLYPVENILGTIDESEKNTGTGHCRFEYLRTLVAQSDAPVRNDMLSLVAGTALIFYQLHFEKLLAKEAIPESFPEALQAPVNLLRLDLALTKMVMSQPAKLDPDEYKALICGMDTSPEAKAFKPLKAYVPAHQGLVYEEYIIRQAGPDHFVAGRTSHWGSVKNLPLLAMYERESAIQIWGKGAADIAVDQGPPLLGLLYLPISALNLVSCRQAWVSGYSSDRVGLALEAGDNLIKLAIGAATTKATVKAMRSGAGLASTLFDGAKFGGRALRLALKVGNLFGAIESGYHWHKAVERGDEAATWAFGVGATLCTLGLALTPFTGGLSAALGGLGLGCYVLGEFFSSSELEGELCTGHYGSRPKLRKSYNPEVDDEALRLLRYACLLTVNKVNPADESEPCAHFAKKLGFGPELTAQKVISVNWPMFVAPCGPEQLSCPYSDAAKYLYLEDTREMLLFMKRDLHQAIVWHNGKKFAAIEGTTPRYEHE